MNILHMYSYVYENYKVINMLIMNFNISILHLKIIICLYLQGSLVNFYLEFF